jgi:periplasmic copper chaperone A
MLGTCQHSAIGIAGTVAASASHGAACILILFVAALMGHFAQSNQEITMSFIRSAALIAAICTVALAALSPIARAHSYKIGELEIGHPWTRATPPGAQVAGGFLTITNKGATADRLISATFTQSSTTEVHEMAIEGGVMKMRELPKGLEIKPGETLALKPGGFHLMFMNTTRALVVDERLKGTLVFEKAGSVDVEFKVESMGFKGSNANDTEHQHHNHAPVKTQ